MVPIRERDYFFVKLCWFFNDQNLIVSKHCPRWCLLSVFREGVFFDSKGGFDFNLPLCEVISVCQGVQWKVAWKQPDQKSQFRIKVIIFQIQLQCLIYTCLVQSVKRIYQLLQDSFYWMGKIYPHRRNRQLFWNFSIFWFFILFK